MTSTSVKILATVALALGGGALAFAARPAFKPIASSGSAFDPFAKVSVESAKLESVVLAVRPRPPFRPPVRSLYRPPPDRPVHP